MNVVIAGGIFVICFVALWFMVRPKWDELGSLKAAVRAMNGQLEEMRRIEAQYKVLKRETDPVMARIVQRPKDFNLSAFVAQAEEELNFRRTSASPAPPNTYGDFEKHTCSFVYNEKTLREIVDFLKKIEKPENVIGIETLRVSPRTGRRSQLTLDIKLATVVRREK